MDQTFGVLTRTKHEDTVVACTKSFEAFVALLACALVRNPSRFAQYVILHHNEVPAPSHGLSGMVPQQLLARSIPWCWQSNCIQYDYKLERSQYRPARVATYGIRCIFSKLNFAQSTVSTCQLTWPRQGSVLAQPYQRSQKEAIEDSLRTP